MNNHLAPIGVFDSGVGGLSVLRAIRAQLPSEEVVYFADQVHVPYGPRPLEEVRMFSDSITRFLLRYEAKLIVVACNAASAAALQSLRQTFPDIPFVGMEPAVKPAAEVTHSGVVGVLATPATFQGVLYTSVVARFAKDVKLLQSTCPGLVEQIEHGEMETAETRRILEEALLPMLAQGLDTIVLGCTHYPFVIPLIREIAGDEVRIIDPAPAITLQVGRLLRAGKMLNEKEAGSGSGRLHFFTSGEVKNFTSLLPRLLGETGEVTHVDWSGDKIV